MLHIPERLDGAFDFVWSCCALEHLGDLEAGWRFVENSIRCLKPNGIAVHTTEYCLSSNVRTIERSSTVLYRRRDLEALRSRLNKRGYTIDLNLNAGGDRWDRLVGLPPYRGRALRQYSHPFIHTSVGLCIIPDA